MAKLFITFSVFVFCQFFYLNIAQAEKWLGNSIVCKKYEDTFGMAIESNLASSDLEAMKVFLKYISNGKCFMHKKCIQVVYKGRGSK